MTVVAAIARDGAIVMVADTETNYAGTPFHRARKVLRLAVGEEHVLIAAAGHGGLVPLVRRHLSLEAPGSDEPLEHWAEGIAIDISELAAAANPTLVQSDDEGSRVDGALLLGIRGRLFYLFTHMAVEVADGVAALGSGTDVAFGAMQVALAHGDSPEDACRAAVRYACRYAQGCSVDEAGPLVEHLAVSR